MTTESVHALKIRIWKQPPKKRTELLSDLETALRLPAGDEQEAALTEISKRVLRGEKLNERGLKRKESVLKAAEDKLRRDLGF